LPELLDSGTALDGAKPKRVGCNHSLEIMHAAGLIEFNRRRLKVL